MSHRLVGRVVSDLSHSNSRSATDHGLHHQSTTTRSSNDGGPGNASKAKRKLALLFSGVVAWTRSSEGSGETGSRARSTKQQSGGRGSGTGARRRGLEIVLAVRKYVAMLEQLFASYSGGSSGRRDGDSSGRDVRRRRPHTFTSGRHGGGNAAAQSSSFKRHKGRLSSAPASLRGSPANSGHLAVGESVMTKTSTSTSSEVSTMEELQSAIQAAIAHCKNSVAAGGGDRPQQQRKC